MTLHRRTFSALALVVATRPAWSQGRTIRLVVPYPPGGPLDIVARALAERVRDALGTVVVENRPGAGGNMGADLVAKAAPDGNTLVMGAVATHAINPWLYRKMPYDAVRDFTPITLVAQVPNVLVMNAEAAARLSIRTLADLVAHAKKNPGKLNYGSAGNGTSHHLAGELFKLQTKTFIAHIPYRGAGPALQDLIAGQVDMMFDGLGSSAAHIKSGRLRAIAVAGDRRAPGFPDVPSTAEGGLAGYNVATWYGIWAPKGTPRELITVMQNEMRKALNADDLKTLWTGLGTSTPNLWGDDFGRFVASEIKRWAEVVKTSGAKLD